jgi:hypothetical protein
VDPWILAVWIALVAAGLWLGRRAFGALGGSSDVMASLFVPPDRRLGWPRGVQESDEPWGWRSPPEESVAATRPVDAVPVRRGPATQLRTPRSAG